MILRLLRRIVPRPILGLYHYAFALISAFWYRSPSKRLMVIGITGTKGKSTTTLLTAQLLDRLGFKSGATSTVGFKIGNTFTLNTRKMTMLGRFATQRLLNDMVKAGCTHAVIETSSEGIAQYRHRGINYDTAVLTNLTPEHLETHGSFEAYRAAKRNLFIHTSRSPKKTLNGSIVKKTGVGNADDPATMMMLERPFDRRITFGTAPASTLRITEIQLTPDGSRFSVNNMPARIQLLGQFNIMNAVAAAAAVHAAGIPLSTILPLLETLEPVPGRQEWINEGQPFRVMVDYAHEPESQKQLFALLTTLPHDRLIHVTGSAGGGRDRARRLKLGALSAQNAAITIVTNEDPYDEKPEDIIAEVAAGAREAAREAGKKDNESLFIVPDRREAIAHAFSLARAGDIVILTGKGSEQAIVIANGDKIPWDERTVARELLRAKIAPSNQ